MRIILVFVLMFGLNTMYAQNLENLNFGSEKNLDIISWNIEDFPKNGAPTLESVEIILKSLNADIIALQGATDTKALQEIIDRIDECETYYESFWYQGLAYIYNSETVQIHDAYEIFYSSEYRVPFPRSPLVLKFSYDGQDYVIINNHLKCCGDNFLDDKNAGDHETRRKQAITLLKDYVDHELTTQNVFILGTLNDLITDESPDNIFQPILDDPDHFMVASEYLSVDQSTMANSELDHIIISNELFANFNQENSSISLLNLYDYLEGGMDFYQQNISDHLPLALSLNTQQTTAVTESDINTRISAFPNPSSDIVNLILDSNMKNARVILYGNSGQILKEKNSMGANQITLDVSDIPSGIYFINIIQERAIIESHKIVILH